MIYNKSSPNIIPWKIKIAWLVSGLFYLYEFLHRVAPSIMVNELMADFQSSRANLGNLSAMYYYAYAIMQVPVGIMIDRYSIRILMIISAVLVGIGSGIFALTSNLLIAEFGRLLIGAGSAFSFASCLKLGNIWFPSKNFGFIVGLTNFLGICGAMLGGYPLAVWINNMGWREPMLHLAIYSFIFAILIAITFQKQLLPNKTINNNNISYLLLPIIRNSSLWKIAIFGGLMVAPVAILSELWEVTYLMHNFMLSKPYAAFIASLTFIGIGFGGPIIGYLSDRHQQNIFFMRYGALLSLISSIMLIYIPNWSTIAITLLHVCFGFTTSSMLLCFKLSKNHVKNDSYATAIGFTNTIIMAGSVLFQPLIGASLDYLQRTNSLSILENYKIVFITIPICQACAYLLTFSIKENYATISNME